MSRFYYALNESENFSDMKKAESNKYALVPAYQINTPLTLNSLVELAKEVSDKMIISKAEVNKPF